MTFMDYVQLIFVVFVIIPVVFMILTACISKVASVCYRTLKTLYSKWKNKSSELICEDKVSLE